jgi:hypothetical protein
MLSTYFLPLTLLPPPPFPVPVLKPFNKDLKCAYILYVWEQRISFAVAKEVYTIYMHKGIEDSGYYAGTNREKEEC